MGLKEGSSSGVGFVDVKYVLAAFEEMNRVKLEISTWLDGTVDRPSIWVEVRAWEPGSNRMAVQPLASWKLRIGSSGPRTMEAAILQGLYAVDAQLAQAEFARVDKK